MVAVQRVQVYEQTVEQKKFHFGALFDDKYSHFGAAVERLQTYFRNSWVQFPFKGRGIQTPVINGMGLAK